MCSYECAHACVCACLSVSDYLSCFCLSIRLSVCMFICHLSVCPPACLYIFLSVHLYIGNCNVSGRRNNHHLEQLRHDSLTCIYVTKPERVKYNDLASSQNITVKFLTWHVPLRKATYFSFALYFDFSNHIFPLICS